MAGVRQSVDIARPIEEVFAVLTGVPSAVLLAACVVEAGFDANDETSPARDHPGNRIGYC